METSVIKKKLSTYVSEGGHLKNVSEELLSEVLSAWEEWQGTAKDFYRAIGFSPKQMASLIGKAKKLKREGYFSQENFKQIHVEPVAEGTANASPCVHIELQWQNDKIIRFPKVEDLLEFIKKAS
jgi:hypothetical protein